MGYGDRCPTCLRPFTSNQTGRGLTSSFGGIVKRAMAREMGRRMAGMAIRLQNAGNPCRSQTQKGSGIIKSILTSKPVRAVGKATVEALPNRAVQAISTPNNRPATARKSKGRRKRKRGNPKTARNISQTGRGLPLLALLAASAPVIGKTVGLGTLGAIANHGVQKLLGK